MTDEAYLAMMQAGDMDGLIELQRRYRSFVLSCAYNAFEYYELSTDTISIPRHVAEDTWTDFVRHIMKNGYDKIGNVKAYLCRSAYNRVNKMYRRLRGEVILDDLFEDILPSKDNVEDEVIQKEDEVDNLVRALSILLSMIYAPGLSTRQRAAVFMRDYKGMSSKDIARALGVAPRSVDSMVSQARATIRKDLDITKK